MIDTLAVFRLFTKNLEEVVDGNPDWTARDLLDYLQQAQGMMTSIRVGSIRDCENCGHPVTDDTAEGQPPVHCLPDGKLIDRGCRAAGWTRRQAEGLTGWDETISRKTYAR